MTNALQIAINLIIATVAVNLGENVWVLGNLVLFVGDDRVVVTSTESTFWCFTVEEHLEEESISLRDLSYALHAADTNVRASTMRAALETEYPWHVAAEDENLWVSDGVFCQP